MSVWVWPVALEFSHSVVGIPWEVRRLITGNLKVFLSPSSFFCSNLGLPMLILVTQGALPALLAGVTLGALMGFCSLI